MLACILFIFHLLSFSPFCFAQYPVPTNAPAGYPSWWFSKGVIVPTIPTNSSPSWPGSYPTSDDYRAINQGQLKNLATAANAEIHAVLPSTVLIGPSAIALQSMISGWVTSPASNADNYAAVNQGQLKSLAAAFYTILGSAGYIGGIGLPPSGWNTGVYPWSASTNSADDYICANIGEAKYLFSFDLTAPPGQLPAWWSQYYFGTTNVSPSAQSPGGNGLTILQAYQQGVNPVGLTMNIVGGNHQSGPSGSMLPQPLVIQELTAAGLAVSNVPLTFSLSGGGSISSGTSTNQSAIFLRTDAGGLAQVTCQLPTGVSGTSQVTVTAGLAQTVTFTESISTNVPAINFQIAGGTVAPATLTFSSVITSPTSVTNVSYYEGSTLLGSSTTTPYSLTLSNVTAGLHIYSSIAQNSGGYTGITNVNYTVTIPPTAWANSQFNNTCGFYVDSVDQLQGVGLPATNAYTAIPWFGQIYLPITYEILFANTAYTSFPAVYPSVPMAAFGGAGGGSPLYTGNTYTFAFCEGGLPTGSTNFTVYTNPASSTYNASDFQILVYAASNFPGTNVAASYTNYFSIPHQGSTNWAAFQNGGYIYTNSFTYNGSTLTTTVAYNLGGALQTYLTSGTNAGTPSLSPLIITHTATGASNYYIVNYRGVYYDSNNTQYPLAVSNPNNVSNTATYNYGYTLDFTNRPAWVSTTLSIPNFQGMPLPAAYAGMSLDQLLQVSTPVTYQLASSNITSTNFTALDNSPELRTNPVLDKFISDMGSNPIVLANFILNQIHLSDGISYNAAGSVSDQSINEGGFNRSAEATFLEREGNPAEQCALLIYFLRRCNVPCAYVFPNQDTLQMLDARMSALLHFQLSEILPNTNNTPQILPVNYPWVVAYDTKSSQWVHIFPWMKDTEITEGDDLNDYLPAGYNTGNGWVEHYLHADTNIMNLNTNDDTLRGLYPIFVTNQLAAYGMTTNDVGVTILDRPHNYNAWSNFPQPWGLASNSLSASNIITTLGGTNLLPGLGASTNIFDTFEATLTRNGGGTILDTGVMRMVDLHNRLFFISTASTNNGSNTISFYMEPLPDGTTNASAFNNASTINNAQSISSQLSASDNNNLSFQITYTRHHQFNTSGLTNTSFLGTVDTETYSPGARPFIKGESAALCLDYGQVTQQMLDVTAQKFWAAQQSGTMTTNTAIGTQLQLMGMSYYKYISDLRNELEPLHKTVITSFFGGGLAKLNPQLTNGVLPTNGIVSLRYPAVDMFTAELAAVGNSSVSTINPASGLSPYTTADDDEVLFTAGGSAEEHTVLNQFYNMTNSASTVHLLQLAALSSNGVITLTSQNYTNLATNLYSYNGVTNSLQTWASNSGMWSSITNALAPYTTNNPTGSLFAPFNVVYITPGPELCASNTYAGLGAFLINNYQGGIGTASLISMQSLTNPPLFGGFGGNAPVDISVQSVQNYASLTESGGGSYSLSLSAPSANTATFTDNGNTLVNNLSATITEVAATPSSGVPSASLSPDALQFLQQISGNNSLSASGTTTAQTLLAVDNSGSEGITSFFGNLTKLVSDPVDTIRGGSYLNDTDLFIPGPMPITLSRNYDSFNEANNEFGVGWKMGCFAYLATNALTNSSLIYAAESDGSVIAYSPKSGSTNTWIPTPTNNPYLCNQRGDAIGSTANPFNNQIVLSVSGSTTNYTLTGADGSTRLYTVASYPIGSGSNTVSRTRPYLRTWTDAQGNTLSFSFGTNTNNTDYGFLNRIAAGNGNFLQLDYDTYGHITQANAADGRILSYAYDGYGDLTSVTRPDNSVISYSYLHATSGTNAAPYSTHLLTQISKPEGRVLINTYDNSTNRRVIAQQAAVGPNNSIITNASFSFTASTNSDGTLTGTTTITDANHGLTTYTYAESQLTGMTDQNNHSIQQTWYTNSGGGAYQRSLATKIDKRGLKTTYLYDAYGNPTNISVTGTITATGSSDTAVTAITYNSLNLPTKIVQPDSNYELITYANSSFPYLPTSMQQYAASGGLMQEVDNTYSTVGSIGTIPFAAGVLTYTSTGIPGTGDLAARSFTYNANGFRSSETDLTGTSDPSLLTTLTYNLRGQLIQKQDSIGRVTQEAYDDLGNHIWEEKFDQNGNAVDWHTWYYGENGDLEWTEGARYNPADITENVFDAGGRLNQHIVWTSQAASGGGVAQKDQATTTYTHDGYGNLTQVLDPLGHTTILARDPVGQLLSSTTAGATDSYSYTPGGDVATHTNPIGGVTTTGYSQTGQPLTRTNPDGTITTWTYLIDGRPSSITYPDGSKKTFAYSDGTHTVTSTLTSSSGSITTVQATDSRGNVILNIDGNGNTTTSSYDGLNRLKSFTGPAASNGAAQRQESHAYDAAGVTDTMIDAAGNVTVTTRDAISRPTSVTLSSNGSLIRSRSMSYSPDHQSVTTMDGNGTDITTTWTDFADKPLLVKKADGGTSTYAYDDDENLLSSVNELGYTTTYSYDGLNRLIGQILPDHALCSFGYDGAGDLTNRTMAGVLTWSATYNNAGQKQSEQLLQGGNSTRSYGYSYYSNGVAGAGQISSITDPRNIVTRYSYDGFSRVSQLAASDPTAGLTQSFSYDNDNQLLQVAQTYQNTNNPSSTVNRTYDPYGCIATEQVYTNGVLKDTWTQTHDALGNRTSLKELNNPSFPYSYSTRGDGLLLSTTFNGGSYTYGYGTDGLLLSRTTPVQTVSVTGRDPVGRLLGQQQSALGSVILNESLSYNLDGTQASYSATRASSVNGTSAPAWNESRSYRYDLRSHLTSESFAPASNSVNQYIFQYDGNSAGGLGLRTQVGLSNGTNGGTAIGTFTENYPNFAQLGNYQANGSLSSVIAPLSTNTVASYDQEGNLISRAPNTGTAGATDALTYDALGRLIGVTRTGSNALTWSAVYDGLGRRVATVQGALVIQSSFDPEHEFEEVAVTVGSARNWFIHGPDLNGLYGGMQGTGGTEGVYNESSGLMTSVLNDVYGDSVASITSGLFAWNPVRATGYGPMWGSTPVPVSGSYALGSLFNWRGHYIDGIGTYHLGARDLQYQTGTWMEPDPLGHAASWDLHQAFNGDPVNNFDPDGRFATQVGQGAVSDVKEANDLAGLVVNPVLQGVAGATQLVGYGVNTVANTVGIDPDAAQAAMLAVPGVAELELGGALSSGVEEGAANIQAEQQALLQLEQGGQAVNLPAAAKETTPFNSMLSKVNSLDFSTPANKAVFYSGPGQGVRATAFAESTGGMTIEMTSGGRALAADPVFQALSPGEQFKIWQAASTPFAKGASGGINAFIRGALPDRTFRSIEEPLLNENANVFKSTYHY